MLLIQVVLKGRYLCSDEIRQELVNKELAEQAKEQAKVNRKEDKAKRMEEKERLLKER